MGSRSARAFCRTGGSVLTDAERDPLSGRALRIVGSRQARPNLPSTDCPFCPGGLEAPGDYDTRWFPNRWPPLPDGRAEVVLYSPEHDASLGTLSSTQAAAVVELWVERTKALGARPDVVYVLVFENRGSDVGATIDHPHGQIYAYNFVPPAAVAELDSAVCTLCDSSNDGLTILRDEHWTVRVPAHAWWPYELLVMANDHVADLPSLDDAAVRGLGNALRRSVAAVDAHFETAAPYMMWVHQRPCDGAPWPSAHLHVHLVPIWRSRGVARYVAAAELGSEVFFNPVEPADAAAALRAALQP